MGNLGRHAIRGGDRDKKLVKPGQPLNIGCNFPVVEYGPVGVDDAFGCQLCFGVINGTRGQRHHVHLRIGVLGPENDGAFEGDGHGCAFRLRVGSWVG